MNKNQIQIKTLKATTNIQGNPHKAISWFSADTLQARTERQDILKVKKGKSLQPRILYLARLSFIFEGEIKALQTQAKRIQHHKTSFTTNIRGNSLGKKSKRKEQKRKENRPTKIPQNNYENCSRHIYIYDLLNANGLNVPMKRRRLAEWIQK